MKKILVILVIALAGISSASSMELSEYKVFYKMNESSTFRSLMKYLDASQEQAYQMSYVLNQTERKLNYANRKESLDAAERAMFFNLGNAKSILSKEQYRKYLIILNISRFSEYDTLAEIL
jgi:hypothetical protein